MTIRILWIDDEHNNHFEAITQAGKYSVVQAMDPFQALEKLSEGDFSFVFVDILYRYPPWELPPEIDNIRKQIQMEPNPVRKGIPLAIWLSKQKEYEERVAIFSNLPAIAKEFPEIGNIKVYSKPSGYQDTCEFLETIVEDGGDADA